MVEAMGLHTVQEIERAIDALTTEELGELYAWLDQRHPQPIDVRAQSDLVAGRLDTAIRRALDDEKNGRVQPRQNTFRLGILGSANNAALRKFAAAQLPPSPAVT